MTDQHVQNEPDPDSEPVAKPSLVDGVEPQLEAALARLASLEDMPRTAQVDELEDVHRLLQEALATLDGV